MFHNSLAWIRRQFVRIVIDLASTGERSFKVLDDRRNPVASQVLKLLRFVAHACALSDYTSLEE